MQQCFECLQQPWVAGRKENDDLGGLRVSHLLICSSFYSSTPASWVSTMLLAFQPGNKMYKFLPLRGSWSLMTQLAKHPRCNISSCYGRDWHGILPCPGEEKLTALCFCGFQILCCYSFPFCSQNHRLEPLINRSMICIS